MKPYRIPSLQLKSDMIQKIQDTWNPSDNDCCSSKHYVSPILTRQDYEVRKFFLINH